MTVSTDVGGRSSVTRFGPTSTLVRRGLDTAVLKEAKALLQELQRGSV